MYMYICNRVFRQVGVRSWFFKLKQVHRTYIVCLTSVCICSQSQWKKDFRMYSDEVMDPFVDLLRKNNNCMIHIHIM